MLRTGCITLLTICAIFKFGAVHADSVQNGSESRQEKREWHQQTSGKAA